MSTYFAADPVCYGVGRKLASKGSAWRMPDVVVRAITRWPPQAELKLEILGFDYHNTKSGKIVDDCGIEGLAIIRAS
jgi:hypothetical protein